MGGRRVGWIEFQTYPCGVEAATTVTNASSERGFRRTLVGLKQLAAEWSDMSDTCFRRTLVGLKQASRSVEAKDALVSDVPLWG